MPPKTLKGQLSRLDSLAPDARKRVEAALKGQIDSELKGNIGLDPNKAAEFSRGVFFSRSRPSSIKGHEEDIIRHASTMDEAAFAKFAKNIGKLKDIQRGGPG